MRCFILLAMAGALTSGGLQSTSLHAETGAEAWLRYAPLDSQSAEEYQRLPVITVVLGDSIVLRTAQQELSRGIKGMLGRSLEAAPGLPTRKAIVLGTVSELNASGEALSPPAIRGDGYWLTHRRVHGFECLVVTANSERGVLYGVFGLLSKIARHQDLMAVDEVQEPHAPLRWIDQWDNLDGRIERGYAGPSIFFEAGRVRDDLTRAGQYARLLASVGINGCTINNVNADPKVLEDGFISQVARVADAFRPWGVRLSLAVDMSTPKASGKLDTFDPLDPRVAAWWHGKVDEIYRKIPDFGGFVVKADSEGRLGPATYRRTPADAANVIARALMSHPGVLFYRAFVYNHHLDWHNLKNDRAKAAYDNFHALDGKFEDNVVIQIKHGPIDFQVREPVSPLLGGLQRTNEAIELQITQEYTGQQRHLCFLVPMWKEVLDFDLHVAQEGTPVTELVAGRTFQRPSGGLVGVANVGMNTNWLGSPLALANLYGFGRLAWDPGLSSQTIVDEWTRLTFGNDPLVVRTITEMQLASWHVYESYTGPLGAGTLTDILGSHYGPGPAASEENGWGQWHRADHEGIGMDRTVATGTGFVGQYSPAVQRQYESLANCPDELLLFFHHVPYTHVLHSGKTVIQHIYDSHYEGADRAQAYGSQWRLLKGHIDNELYAEVLARLQYQAGHAIVWRDAINDWFHRMSGIPDQRGRVGRHPERIEAEDLQLQGYAPFSVEPWESASGGKAVKCPDPIDRCTAALKFTGAAGEYEVDVQYFDQNNGASRFRVSLGDHVVDEWLADDHLPSAKPNADSSTRRVLHLALKPGDEIQIEGAPDNGESAPLDYVEIRAQRPQQR
jgi:alpha-glucuronidase